MVTINGKGTVRLPVSPSNPAGYGKAKDVMNATAIIEISGYQSYDYTRVPIRQSKSGTARALTIGRF